MVNHAADQHHLELQCHLEDVRGEPAAHRDAPLEGLLCVPVGGGERSDVGVQLPTRVIGVQCVFGGVPVDVDERIEAPARARPAERCGDVGVESCRRTGVQV